MTRRALITRLGPVVALVLLLVPYPYLAVPDWDVQVVNDQGAPMEDMTVRLTYVNYSAESSGHKLDATTDGEGRAHFKRQSSLTCLAQWVWCSMASFGEGVHASFGRHATVFTFGQGWEGEAVSGEFVMDWAGSPDHVSSRIVARPRPIIN